MLFKPLTGKELTLACNTFDILVQRATRRLAFSLKRRALVDPALQHLAVRQKLDHPRVTDPGLQDTVSWLRKCSGARRKADLRTPRKSSLVCSVKPRILSAGVVNWLNSSRKRVCHLPSRHSSAEVLRSWWQQPLGECALQPSDSASVAKTPCFLSWRG